MSAFKTKSKCSIRFSFIPVFLIALCFSLQLKAQTEGIYKGKFSLPAGSQQNAAFYQNSLIISIDKAGAVTGKLSFKGGSASEPDEYVYFSGTFRGQLQGASFNATGSTTMLMLDNKKEKTDKISFSLSGNLISTGSASQIKGKLSITNSGEEGGTEFLAYTAGISEGEGMQLTYPLGKSPMVFNKGWKFGASCILNEGTDSEIDLSNDIEWSGTATFSPAKGPLSSPVFENEGANKIILTVQDAEGNVFKKEFKVEVVDVTRYAYSGCFAFCQADAHGCLSCPHTTVGFINGSAADVTINGLPAAVVGDNGTHTTCCGPNTFELIEGDPNVLINGKQAVLLGAKTRHCGGTGTVVKSMPKIGQVIIANDSAYFLDPWGDPRKLSSDLYKRLDTEYIGTTYLTHERGSLTLSLFPKGILSAGPNSQFKIVSDEGGVMKIHVDKGNLYFNGHSTGEGEVVIELKDCGLVLKGTRFSLFVSEQTMKLDLLEGNVDLKFNKSGETVAIHQGESVSSDFNTVTATTTVDAQAVSRQWQQIAESTPGVKVVEIPETGSSATAGWKKYLTSQVLMLAGSVVFILAILAGLLRRRKKNRFKKMQGSQYSVPPVNPSAGNVYQQTLPPIPSPDKVPPINPTAGNVYQQRSGPQNPLPTQAPKFCPSCGTPLKPGSKFCGACGFKTSF